MVILGFFKFLRIESGLPEKWYLFLEEDLRGYLFYPKTGSGLVASNLIFKNYNHPFSV